MDPHRRDPVVGKRHTSQRRRAETVGGVAISVGSLYTPEEHDYTYGRADPDLVVKIVNDIVERENREDDDKKRRARERKRAQREREKIDGEKEHL